MLSRSDRVFHAGDNLVGEVVISTPTPVTHNGVRVCASGSVQVCNACAPVAALLRARFDALPPHPQMRVSERAVGVFEAFFLNVRPVALLNETVEARAAVPTNESNKRAARCVCVRPTVRSHSARTRTHRTQVAPPGRCEEGVTRLPFALPLRAPAENPSTPLYETYHGINVSVQYGVAAEMERSLVRGGKLSTVRARRPEGVWRLRASPCDVKQLYCNT